VYRIAHRLETPRTDEPVTGRVYHRVVIPVQPPPVASGGPHGAMPGYRRCLPLCCSGMSRLIPASAFRYGD
jgi:hypothetical protein